MTTESIAKAGAVLALLGTVGGFCYAWGRQDGAADRTERRGEWFERDSRARVERMMESGHVDDPERPGGGERACGDDPAGVLVRPPHDSAMPSAPGRTPDK